MRMSARPRRRWMGIGLNNGLPCVGTLRLSPGVTRALHSDEIPIDTQLVRALVGRAMPQHIDLPIRQLAWSGSTNALFVSGRTFWCGCPRQPGGIGGSATI